MNFQKLELCLTKLISSDILMFFYRHLPIITLISSGFERMYWLRTDSTLFFFENTDGYQEICCLSYAFWLSGLISLTDDANTLRCYLLLTGSNFYIKIITSLIILFNIRYFTFSSRYLTRKYFQNFFKYYKISSP